MTRWGDEGMCFFSLSRLPSWGKLVGGPRIAHGEVFSPSDEIPLMCWMEGGETVRPIVIHLPSTESRGGISSSAAWIQPGEKLFGVLVAHFARIRAVGGGCVFRRLLWMCGVLTIWRKKEASGGGYSQKWWVFYILPGIQSVHLEGLVALQQ